MHITLASPDTSHLFQPVLYQVATGILSRTFRHKDPGSMATLSRTSAVVSAGRLQFTGLLARLAWLFVHLLDLVGFKSRVTTLLHGFVSFVGRGGSEGTRRPLPDGSRRDVGRGRDS